MAQAVEVQVLSRAQENRDSGFCVLDKKSRVTAFREDLKSGAGHPFSRMGRELWTRHL